MPQHLPELDHAVINVSARLDEAAARYRRLGFQLTPRGHHSLGSSNHLAIFDNNYLELLGYEGERGLQRQAVWQSPPGLSGLVWKTADAEASYRQLHDRGLADQPAAAFFRPVTLPDGRQLEARFRTVAVDAPRVPNGRSFFCQHLTPDAVWQTAWQVHPNGARQIVEFVIASHAPSDAVAVYARLFGEDHIQQGADGEQQLVAGAATVRFITTGRAQEEFGALPTDYDGSPRMIALGLRTDDLQQTRASLQAGEIPFSDDARGVVVSAAHGFHLALRFTE